jgi:hypothetical protein
MSAWKQSAAKRRDERSDRSQPRRHEPVVIKRHKDTKRWCGGHEGREHTAKCVAVEHAWVTRDTTWYNLQCVTCGKILDRYWPMGWDNSKKTKPEWVKP